MKSRILIPYFCTKHGNPLRSSYRRIPAIFDGKIIGVFGVAKDITETKENGNRVESNRNKI